MKLTLALPLLWILPIAFLASCKSKIALDYSEMVVKKEKSLGPSMRETQEKTNRYMAYDAFDSIVAVNKLMEEKVETALDEIKKTPAPDVSEGENFKNASIKYFEYIKSVFESYRKYGEANNIDDRNKERQKIKDIHDQQDDAIADMQGAQRKYAKANGFRIEGQK